MRRAVAGRDTLAIMPTGAGKSLCYQLAAMLRPEPTLVLSPLIALMKDQVDNLPAEIRRRTGLINSSLDPAEAARRVQAMATGEYKLVYVAPERLRQRHFVAALRGAGIGLIVIDEVHCVSMWGHDFRPDYLFIGSALETLGNPPVLGLTATATPTTAEDIASSLGRDMDVVRTSVVRDNLRYEVRHVDNEDDRRRELVAIAGSIEGPGIVYARSREKCEGLAQLLRKHGVRAQHYHAGLAPDERSAVQEQFLAGAARVVVATTAFGMGIDKADIRWVVLYNYPDSIEDYVQRVGRAGRDGKPSTCILFAGTADASNLRKFARNGVPSIDVLRSVYAQVRARAEDGIAEVSPESVREACALGEDVDPRVLVGMLERAGLVRRQFDLGRAMQVAVLPPPPDTKLRIDTLLRAYEVQSLERAARIIAFGDALRCRHLQVAEHFGETLTTPCGRCDVCVPSSGRREAPAAATRPLPEDIASAILEAVGALRYPVGLKGLAATLRGTVDTPPSARTSPGYGVLAGATASLVNKWLQALIEGGHLEPYVSEDGYRLLRVGSRRDLPSFRAPGQLRPRAGAGTRHAAAPVDSASAEPGEALLFDRLRAWRFDRAQAQGVPPFLVCSDAVLHAIATHRPHDLGELQFVNGMGPKKVEQYGDDIVHIINANPIDDSW